MALENAVRVEKGKVLGAYASQAKNISYKNGSVEDALDANTLGNAVDISSYNTENNRYVFPKDGYISLQSLANDSRIVARIYSADGNIYFPIETDADTNIRYQAVFVKAGMSAMTSVNTGTNNIFFYSL